MLTVHVDDQLIACNNRKLLDDFNQGLMRNLNVQTVVLLITSWDSMSLGIEPIASFTSLRNTTWKLYWISLT